MIQLAACLTRHLPLHSESRPDGELLAAFLAERDESAFAELVRRHGPLVWAACRRLLPDAADAEDAFQSAFLVLVRRARRLSGRDALGPWLYRVAVWTARNIRRRNARMLARRRPLPDDSADRSIGCAAVDLRADLDAALSALPEKYRTPLVLCHLQGWSRRDAAARLGCPEGTLTSLLARGLHRLRVKLSGFDPAKALAVATPAVPLLLANATVKAATGVHLAAAGAMSATVSSLVEGVLRMFWVKKATAASVALFALFGFGMGIGVSVNRVPGAAAGDGPPALGESIELAQLEEALVADDLTLQKAQVLLKEAEAAMDLAQAGGNAKDIDAAKIRLFREKRRVEDALRLRDENAARLALRLLTRKAAAPEADDLVKLKQQLATAEKHLKDLESALEEAKVRLGVARSNNDALAEAKAKKALELALASKEDAARKIDELRARIEGFQRERVRSAQEALGKDSLVVQLAAKQADFKKLDAQLAKLKAEQELLRAEAAKLAAERDRFQREMVDLESKRADDVNRLRASELLLAADASALEITVNSKDALWPFKITEIGTDGKPVGTAVFDNIEILKRYLVRAGKDAKPKTVRLTVQADSKFDVVKKIVEACTAAGLKLPTVLNIDKLKSEAKMSDFTDLAERIDKLSRP